MWDSHKIVKFANEGLQVNLAISLHAPNDELRSKMKINKVYPLKVLWLQLKTMKRITNRRNI